MTTPLDVRIPVMQTKYARGWPKWRTARREDEVCYLPPAEAFSTAWETDAHFAAYSVPTLARRLDSDAPNELGAVPMVLLVGDFDCPKALYVNGAVPEWWRVDQGARVAVLRALHPELLMYETRGGFRLVAQLATPRMIEGERGGDGALAWRRWYLLQLAYFYRVCGIEGDPACKDGMRLYRLPHATRDGVMQDWPMIGPEMPGVWSYAPTADDDAADVAAVLELAKRRTAETRAADPKASADKWLAALREFMPHDEADAAAGFTRAGDDEGPTLPLGAAGHGARETPDVRDAAARRAPSPPVTRAAPGPRPDTTSRQRQLEAWFAGVLDGLCHDITHAPHGSQNIAINGAALRLGRIVKALDGERCSGPYCSRATIHARLLAASVAGKHPRAAAAATINSGLDAARSKPPAELPADKPNTNNRSTAKTMTAPKTRPMSDAEVLACVNEALDALGEPTREKLCVCKSCRVCGAQRAARRGEGVDEVRATLAPDVDPDDDAVSRAATDTAVAPVEWQTPAPLDAPPPVPPFPSEVLSPWVRDIVEAAAVTLQVPADLPGAFVLPLLGGALTHRCEVSPRAGWTEPPALYALVIANSGEKKSPVVSLLTRPIIDLEHARGQAMAPDIRKARSAKATAARRVEHLQGQVARGKGDTVTLDHAEQELEGITVPASPRYVLGGDATPEALGKLLGEQGERLTVATAEGGAVEDLTGLRYAKSAGLVSCDLLLKSHDGDRVTIDRATRETLILHAPLLNLALAVQPDVFRTAADRPELLNRGVLARFLTCWPDSRVGWRNVNTPSWPAGVLSTYDEHMRALWELPESRDDKGRVIAHTLPFSAAAWELFNAWRADVEVRRRPGALFNDPGVLLAWSNKLDGTCARLAGVLHVADRAGRGEAPLEGAVSADTVTRAMRLCEYFAAHAVRAFASIAGHDPAMDDAAAILATLRHRADAGEILGEVSVRDVQRMRSNCTAGRALAALAVLTERGWMREKPAPERTGPGRPPAKVYEVNPAATGETGRAATGGGSVNIVNDSQWVATNTHAPRSGDGPDCVNIVNDSGSEAAA